MSYLKTLAISCGVQPTANKPAQIAPALLPAIRFIFFNIPQSSNAYKLKQQHHRPFMPSGYQCYQISATVLPGARVLLI